MTILFLFYRRFIGTTLTENLGLSLGAVGLAVLWRGSRERQHARVLIGIFLLSLALNARAGAFFVLPLLVLWGMWLFRGRSRLSLRFLVEGIGVVLLAFAINLLLLKVLAPEGSTAFSNFSYTFYGLVVGGKGWG